MISLDKLGTRICIIGCSSSGKSTLATKISAKLSIPAYHLDVLAHYPYSHWQRRPENDLLAKHEKILKENKWIIDGNYSLCMAERVNKASSIIWLDTPALTCAFRYLVRSLKNDPRRTGGLPGSKRELSLFMFRQILFRYPSNRLKYQKLIKHYENLILPIYSMKKLNQYYHYWNL